jgi:hypothetical protein
MEELRTLFKAQWSNGMVPHIVFNPEVGLYRYSRQSLLGLGPQRHFFLLPLSSSLSSPPSTMLLSLHQIQVVPTAPGRTFPPPPLLPPSLLCLIFQYWNSTYYFPGPDWWQSYAMPQAPKGVNTSGLCNPPVHATAVLRLFQNAAKKHHHEPELRNFLSEMYPKLVLWHTYLARERDPDGLGLIYTRHPWESGMDNSPAWDPVLDRIKLTPEQIPKFNRTDCKHVNCTDRPSQFDYDRYVYLLVLYRNNSYNETKLREVSPFLVLDTLFNSIWSKANFDLAEIATILGHARDARMWSSLGLKTRHAMNKYLWNPELGVYQDYDLVAKTFISEFVIAGNFLPIYGNVPDNSQLNAMFGKWLDTDHFCAIKNNSCYVLPTLDMTSVNFTDHNYWRGPVWINMDWLLYQGLQKYNSSEIGVLTPYIEKLWNSIIGLVEKNGMYEYFSPLDGTPHGTGNFSWTASLIIDLLSS